MLLFLNFISVNILVLCLGVKPYACTMCDMRFIQRYQLERHSLTHTGTSSFFWTLTLSFPDFGHAFVLMFTWLLQTRVCIAFCLYWHVAWSFWKELYKYLQNNTFAPTLYMKWHNMMTVKQKCQHHSLCLKLVIVKLLAVCKAKIISITDRFHIWISSALITNSTLTQYSSTQSAQQLNVMKNISFKKAAWNIDGCGSWKALYWAVAAGPWLPTTDQLVLLKINRNQIGR